jgi:hypothetical protein
MRKNMIVKVALGVLAIKPAHQDRRKHQGDNDPEHGQGNDSLG